MASGTLATLQEMGAVIASAAVGALLQNRLATSLHAQAVSAAAHVPADSASSFVVSFNGAAANGLQIGAGQTGASLKIPPGTPSTLVATLQSLAHSVFTQGFVAAMKPTLLLPIVRLVLAAVASLFARGHSAGERVPTPSEADGEAAATLPQLVREGEPV